MGGWVHGTLPLIAVLGLAMDRGGAGRGCLLPQRTCSIQPHNYLTTSHYELCIRDSALAAAVAAAFAESSALANHCQPTCRATAATAAAPPPLVFLLWANRLCFYCGPLSLLLFACPSPGAALSARRWRSRLLVPAPWGAVLACPPVSPCRVWAFTPSPCRRGTGPKLGCGGRPAGRGRTPGSIRSCDTPTATCRGG